MTIADKLVRQRLYKEYNELEGQYRRLIDKLSRLPQISVDFPEIKQLAKVGKQLEDKRRELDESYGVRRF